MISPLAVDFRSITDFGAAKVKAFDCANEEMNFYFHRMAKKNHKSNLSPCIVIVPKDQEGPILGYVTVSNVSVEKADPPEPQFKKFPAYPIPLTLVSRLAVSKDYQGKKLGRTILMHVFYNQYRAVNELNIGSVGVITDAIDDKARRFYAKNDFSVLPDENKFPKRMFIGNETIFEAIGLD